MPGNLLLRSAYIRVEHLVHEVAKFGVVGLVAYIVDIGLFNMLRGLAGNGPLADKPLTASIVSATVATTVAYFGNRHWTFRHRARSGLGREAALFFLFNGVGMLITAGCLWFSHYALGFDGLLADNISRNVVGLALGTAFRFWAYRRFVFLQVTPLQVTPLQVTPLQVAPLQVAPPQAAPVQTAHREARQSSEDRSSSASASAATTAET